MGLGEPLRLKLPRFFQLCVEKRDIGLSEWGLGGGKVRVEVEMEKKSF